MFHRDILLLCASASSSNSSLLLNKTLEARTQCMNSTNFPANQILREIIVSKLSASKLPIFPFSDTLILVFGAFLQFFRAEFYQNCKSQLVKMAK